MYFGNYEFQQEFRRKQKLKSFELEKNLQGWTSTPLQNEFAY